jgi:two-component system OmpR family sensor kinase
VRQFAVRSRRTMTRFSARIPLRIKLITAVLMLVAIALAVISAVSIVVFHRYLLHQADQQLSARARRLDNFGGYVYVSPPAGVPGRILTEVLDSSGRPLQPSGIAPAGVSPPDIPPSKTWIRGHDWQLVTVPATSGGGSWRVAIKPIHYTLQRMPFTPDGVTPFVTSTSQPGLSGTYVVGLDIGSISHTIGTLTMIDLAVGGVVIVILAGAGVALVRASLRPLAEIEQTAGAIAAGDLSRRVPDRDPRTEVGSLAQSLNMMLGQIEHAVRAHSASEATARRSEERMRRFVADASHELRTPLSVIRGFAEYYRQRGGLREDELDRMIRRVEDEAARMGMLVEDLLLLARLDQQRPLQRRSVDLLALAADAVQDARMLAPARHIQLSVVSGGPFLILGDEARLRQIIGNLVNNAITHTPDTAPIALRLRTGSAGRRALAGHAVGGDGKDTTPTGEGALDAVVVLEVADSGPGLTPQQAERVFERFYRADAARTRKTGGTGLGLAIVAALSAAHGGTVSVDAQPGQGATFRITLPMAPDAAGIRAADSD